VHPANIPDRSGGQRVLEAAGGAYPGLQHLWADQGYTGTLQRWAAQEYGWSVQVVYPTWRQLQRYAPALLPDLDYAKRFHVLPGRWVVERTFAWLGRQRRLSKDYERLAGSAEALLYLAGIRSSSLGWHERRNDTVSHRSVVVCRPAKPASPPKERGTILQR
jgi:putative transposase